MTVKLPPGLNVRLPDPIVHATATSRYTIETIDRRLAYLRSIEEAEDVKQEIEFLENLRTKPCPS